jgi:hypothetical protein
MRSSQRVLVLLLVSHAVFAVGCIGSNGDETGAGQPVEIRPVPGIETVRFHSGMTTQQRLVVRDETTWSSVWLQIVGSLQPVPASPKVDWDSSYVIVAAMGTRNSGGFSIGIDEVRVGPDGASVSVTETSPGSHCLVLDVITAPLVAVLVPAFPGKASFFEHTAVHDCP